MSYRLGDDTSLVAPVSASVSVPTGTVALVALLAILGGLAYSHLRYRRTRKAAA